MKEVYPITRRWEDRLPLRIKVSNSRNFTSNVFFEYLLPEVNKFYNSYDHPDYRLVLDFVGVKFIDPFVISNLFVVATYYKEYGPIELSFNWFDYNFLKFLNQFNFFEAIRYNNLFYVNTYPSGFEQDNKGFFSYFNVVERGDSEGDILRDLSSCAGKSIRNFIPSVDIVGKFYKTVSELALNSTISGEANAFVCAHAGSTNGLKFSVSDAGAGLLAGLAKTSADTKLFSTADLETMGADKFLYAIIEAVVRRSDKKTYGIWSVINDIVELDGTVRIHTENTQLVFTKNLMQSCLEANRGYGLRSFCDYLCRQLKRRSYNYRVRTGQLKGVHVELHIPKIGGRNDQYRR